MDQEEEEGQESQDFEIENGRTCTIYFEVGMDAPSGGAQSGVAGNPGAMHDESSPMEDIFGGKTYLVHVLHEGSSHKYLGRHIPGNLKQRGRVELHHRKTIAWAKFNKHRTILTNKHVSLKLRLKFFNAVVTPAMVFSLHTLALTKVQLENINVLQRKMLQSIVGWVRVNGEDWSETMRRMNHRLSVALELFPLPPWTEQLAKRQFQFAAKVASEQSWSSVVGHWTCTAGWQANFDSMPSRKRGRPLVKWRA